MSGLRLIERQVVLMVDLFIVAEVLPELEDDSAEVHPVVVLLAVALEEEVEEADEVVANTSIRINL